MSEYLAMERETANETFDLLQQNRASGSALSSDHCLYCDTRPDSGDPTSGWHLMFDWEEINPGDVVYASELWMACRRCNWQDGAPVHIPDGAVILKGHRVPPELLATANPEPKLVIPERPRVSKETNRPRIPNSTLARDYICRVCGASLTIRPGGPRGRARIYCTEDPAHFSWVKKTTMERWAFERSVTNRSILSDRALIEAVPDWPQPERPSVEQCYKELFD